MNVMDDTVDGTWQLNPSTRRRLRLGSIRAAMETRNFDKATIEIEELLDDEPEDAEALWLLGEALMELRDFITAKVVYKSHIELAGPRPATLIALAIAAFESCNLDEAAAAAQAAIELCEDIADAHYILGLCTERLDSPAAATVHFAAAHRMSPLSFPYPLSLSDHDWLSLVDAAIGQLEPPLRAFWREVPVKLELFPRLDELQRSVPPISPRVAALYDGTPAEEDANRPSSVRVFTGSLARSDTPESLIHQLIEALEAEALDWLDAERVEDL